MNTKPQVAPRGNQRIDRRVRLLRLLEAKSSKLDDGSRLSTTFTIAQLAHALEASERTVKDDLAALEHDGLLRRERNPSNPNRASNGRLKGRNWYLIAPRADQGVYKTAGQPEGQSPSSNGDETAGRTEGQRNPIAPQTLLRAKTFTASLVGRPQTDEPADTDMLAYRGHSLTGSLEDFHAAIDTLNRDTCNGGVCGGGRHCRRHTRRVRAT